MTIDSKNVQFLSEEELENTVGGNAGQGLCQLVGVLSCGVLLEKWGNQKLGATTGALDTFCRWACFCAVSSSIGSMLGDMAYSLGSAVYNIFKRDEKGSKNPEMIKS